MTTGQEKSHIYGCNHTFKAMHLLLIVSSDSFWEKKVSIN